jgi:predicted ATPase
VHEAGDEPMVGRLQAFLGDKRVLLVLDNVGQVVGPVPVVAGLLGACPSLTAHVTSQMRLREPGEHVDGSRPAAV